MNDFRTPEAPVRKSPFEPFVHARNILFDLRTLPGGYYLGDEATASKATFRAGDFNGETRVVVDEDDQEEMIMRGVFRIDPRRFNMTADAGFDPDNAALTSPLSNIKASCHLVPVIGDPQFNFTIADYGIMCKNIRAIQEKVGSDGACSGLGVLHRLGGEGHAQPFTSIKLSHSLFTKTIGREACNNAHSASLVNWPVSDRCAAAFQHLLKDGTYELNPIPAFDIDRNPIVPHEYRQMLCGSVVEAHFSLIHFPVEGNKPSTFTTVLRKMVMLRPPARTKRNRTRNQHRDVGPFTLNVIEVGQKRQRVVAD